MSPETTRERLKVVAAFGTRGCTPAEFAARAYPDSREWRKPVRRRRTRGGMLIRSAAGVLGRLRSRNLVIRKDGRYFVTDAGKVYLQAKHSAQQAQPRASKPRPSPPGGQWVPAPFAPGGYLWWDGARYWRPDAKGTLQYWGPPI